MNMIYILHIRYIAKSLYYQCNVVILENLPCITCCKFDNVLALFCHPFFSMIKTQEKAISSTLFTALVTLTGKINDLI